jgi:hypothetical protein
MSAFKIEVAQGCVKTWSKTFAHEPTVQNVIDAIKADPKSFKGEPDLCDYRMKPEDEPLTLDAKLQSGRLFAKKRDGKKKSAVSSSSTPSSKKVTSSKKDKEEGYDVNVDLPATASGPSNLGLSGRGVCFLFPTTEAATEFAVQTCTEYGVDLKKAIVEQEKDKKKLRADKLRAELAELEADEQGDKQDSSSSSSEGEEIDIEDIDVVSAPESKQKEEPVADEPVADEPVAAVAKSKSSKKGSK